MDSLANELLLRIFELAVEEVHYPSIAKCADVEAIMYKRKDERLESPLIDVNRKMAIMTTCKRWSEVAIDLVYRTIVFTEPKEPTSLLAILHRHPDRALMVKGIFVVRNVGDADSSQEDDDAFPSIIHLTKNLSVLHFNRYISVPKEAFERVRDFESRLFDAMLASNAIQHLSISFVTQAIDAIAATGSGLLNLRTLSIACFWSEEAGESNTTPAFQISLPSLTSLGLAMSYYKVVATVEQWHIPNLVDLDFNIADAAPEESLIMLEDIVNAFAQQLTSLRIFRHFRCICCTLVIKFPGILEACPNLKSFSCNAEWMSDTGLVSFPHQHLEHINLLGHVFVRSHDHPRSMIFFPDCGNKYGLRMQRWSNGIGRTFDSINRMNFPSLRLVNLDSTSDTRTDGIPGEKGNYPPDGNVGMRFLELLVRCLNDNIRLENGQGIPFAVDDYLGNDSPWRKVYNSEAIDAFRSTHPIINAVPEDSDSLAASLKDLAFET